MTVDDLARVLAALGIPPEKTAGMAAQLDKRARQLSVLKNCSYDESLQHLLRMVQQGRISQTTDPTHG